MVALTPISLPATPTPGRIALDRYPNANQIKVANYSPFAIRIRIGGQNYWLDLLTADRYELQGSRQVTYEPQAAVSPGQAGTLLVQVADQLGEVIPGIYPLHLR